MLKLTWLRLINSFMRLALTHVPIIDRMNYVLLIENNI